MPSPPASARTRTRARAHTHTYTEDMRAHTCVHARAHTCTQPMHTHVHAQTHMCACTCTHVRTRCLGAVLGLLHGEAAGSSSPEQEAGHSPPWPRLGPGPPHCSRCHQPVQCLEMRHGEDVSGCVSADTPLTLAGRIDRAELDMIGVQPDPSGAWGIPGGVACRTPVTRPPGTTGSGLSLGTGTCRWRWGPPKM